MAHTAITLNGPIEQIFSHICAKRKIIAISISCVIAIYVRPTNMPVKLMPYIQISPCADMTHLCQYMFQMNSLQSTETRITGIHTFHIIGICITGIHFTLLAYAPEQT